MKHLTEMLRGVLEGVVLQKIQTGETGNLHEQLLDGNDPRCNHFERSIGGSKSSIKKIGCIQWG
ncbi:hypothetical protein ABEY41_12305 [Peribacillus butanolivorans]|uniref:hypothetical protein n=1 Tax=Peribacillus butanolivorans TaxID=421767 RepID=UPI003D2A32EB